MLAPFQDRPSQDHDARHRIVVVASRYNHEFVGPMTEAFMAELTSIEPQTSVEVHHAPGSFEIPFLAAAALEHRKPDAVVCFGVIFQGATGHADLVASSVSDALCNLSVQKLVPVIHGVLLLDDREQAAARCLGKEMNRGTECARAVIEILRSSKGLGPR